MSPVDREAIDAALALVALTREMEAKLPDSTTPLSAWLRAHRQHADQLTAAAAAGRAACDPEPVTDFCASSAQRTTEAAQRWRSLLDVIEGSKAMAPGVEAFGPASFAVETLAWSLARDAQLREQFDAGELSRVRALLAVGVRYFAEENPRYLLTATALDCVQREPELSVADLLVLSVDAPASRRDAVLRCTRAFLSRLVASGDK